MNYPSLFSIPSIYIVGKRGVTMDDLENMSEAEKAALKRHDVGYKLGKNGVMPCNEGFFCPVSLPISFGQQARHTLSATNYLS